MKITPQDYARLEKHVKQAMEETAPASTSQKYTKPVAYRWNMFFHASDKLMRTNVDEYNWLRDMYSYLNDDNLDTALRKITGTK